MSEIKLVQEINDLKEILMPKSFREIADLLDDVDRFIVKATGEKQNNRDQILLRKFADSFEEILRDKIFK